MSKILAAIPFVLFIWYLVFRPLLGYISTPNADLRLPVGETAADWQNRAFLSALLATTLLLAIVNRSRLNMSRLWSSPAVISLAAYLALSAASVTWAYNPSISFNRFCQELMIVIPTILPFALISPQKDTIRSLYLCYALAIFINVIVILNQKPVLTGTGAIFGYFGYFTFKGYLGECASVAILLSSYLLLFPGWRRYLAIIVILASLGVVFASESKGSLAFMLVAPCLAALTFIVSARLRVPMVAVLAAIPACFVVASKLSGTSLTARLSYMFYGDSTLTGRTTIWDFAYGQIAERPWFGWGFHSFWLVGSDAPSVTQAPYWVKVMTGSHSGYIDVKLETGAIGYTLFIIFILATLFALERVRRQSPLRAWILLSLALYVIITNLIETIWLVTNDPLWLLFMLIVAETTRYPKLAEQGSFVATGNGRRRKSGPIRQDGVRLNLKP